MTPTSPSDDDGYANETAELIRRSTSLGTNLRSLGLNPQATRVVDIETTDGSHHPGCLVVSSLTEDAFSDPLDDDLRELEKLDGE